MITSASNQQIKDIQLLLEKSRFRREKGLFVIEGIRMFLETPVKLIERVYASEEFMKKSIHASKVSKLPHEIISDQVFKKMSATQTPQGILALVRMPKYDIASLMAMKGDDMYLILNEIQDPGNMGTMLRTAEGAGVKAVILDKGCTDLFNPKVIRSTMGSIYRVPFIITEDLEKTLQLMKKSGVRLVAGHLKGQTYYEDVDYSGSIGIMIGNEGRGLSDNAAALADIKVRIPMEGKVESLNAAISAALFMYEVRRSK